MSAQSSNSQAVIGAGGLDGLSTELETIAVLCSAVPEINEDLREVSARVDAIENSTDELEDDTTDLQAQIDDLGDAFGQLATNMTSFEETLQEELNNFQSQLDEVQNRLDAVEGCLNPKLVEKQTAHVEAKKGPLPFSRGDEFSLVIEEVQGRPDSTLRGEIQKVQTFVDVDDPTEYKEGDTVDITITDLNDSAAHAVPIESFGG
jgi:ABC-type transporter Mla subunit MlaD